MSPSIHPCVRACVLFIASLMCAWMPGADSLVLLEQMHYWPRWDVNELHFAPRLVHPCTERERAIHRVCGVYVKPYIENKPYIDVLTLWRGLWREACPRLTGLCRALMHTVISLSLIHI